MVVVSGELTDGAAVPMTKATETAPVKLRSGRISRAPVRLHAGAASPPQSPTAPAKTKKDDTAGKQQKRRKKETAPKTKKEKKEKKAAPEPKRKQLYDLAPGKRREAQLPDLTDTLSAAEQAALQALNVEGLKRVLRANDCICTGTKGDLRARVAWMVVHGVPERCPACCGGRLKVDVYGEYFCPGSYDDDVPVPCSYTTAVPKTHPWVKQPGCDI